MKKSIFVFIICSFMTACGSGGGESTSAQTPVASPVIESHYTKRIDEFTANPPLQGQTQMWGDSNTEGMFREVKEYFSQNEPTDDPIQTNAKKLMDRVYNAGISSITSYGYYSAVDLLLASKPKEVIIMLGTNDINFGWPTFPSYKKILDKVIEAGAKPYVISVLPRATGDLTNNTLVDVLNKKLKKTCDEMGIDFVDTNSVMKTQHKFMLADGLHYNVNGFIYHASLIELGTTIN